MNKKIRINIGNNIKDARKAARLTQLEVAESSDINVNYYAKIERGEVVPSLITLFRILNAVGIKTLKIPNL